MQTYQFAGDECDIDVETGVVRLRMASRNLRLGPVSSSAVLELMETLASEPLTEGEIHRRLARGGVAALPFVGLVPALTRSAWLRLSVRKDTAEVPEAGTDGEVLLELAPICPAPGSLRSPPRTPALDSLALCLAPSAVITIRDGGYVIEAGDVRFLALVRHPGVWDLIGRLAAPVPFAGLQASPPAGLTNRDVASVLTSLLDVGIVTGDEPTNAGRLWSAWEMLFHSRSRLGRNIGGYGGTYPLRDREKPYPALMPSRYGERTALPRPDLLTVPSAPLVEVSERRSSIRTQDDAIANAERDRILRSGRVAG